MVELTVTSPVLSPIAIGAKRAAAMFGLSDRTWTRLYPDTPLARDAQDRLDEIAREIDQLDWRGNAHLATERLAALTAERRRLPTEKRGGSDGSRP